MQDNDNLKALQTAARLETDGRAYYLRQAERHDDPCAKELFNTLADQELHHLSMVRKAYDALSMGGKWLAFAEAAKAAPVGPLAPFEMLKRDLQPDANDTDALLNAIQFENESFALYFGESQRVSDPAARQMYQYLAAAERGHFDLLMLNYENMLQVGAWLGTREGC